ncbi:alpha-(1-_3)-arabinofuranosyltransferase [Streptosporangium sp. NBC_01495]|uniref:alpha-(1->3)-arabinofuranosyltransferase n=1 Tax=Streptosporangium sp. NBC_01495 TaxID=2903899 RepID=UPI002E3747FC|nr:alpha-(1->3)-arabinofuranosyltransferase [Streptosporangium sp. NBC_01495]
MTAISEAWINRLSAPPSEFGASDTGLRRRLRLLAGCLFLAAVAFNMAPGLLIAETKLDMPINPIGFLSQALNMWDQDYLGHLQNQAYGYVFPMGPFYTLLTGAGMPPWVVQRLWVTLILCVAFVGVAQVARALRIGGQLAGVLAGLAYALAPHAQALMGFNSVEFAPSAVLPWVLLFLVRGARGETSPRRAACLSALAFLFAGGINAAAELAVLVVPMIYLLTRARGPRKRRLIAWWLAAVAAVSFWWLAPLVLLGRYVFSFLPFTENARTTTLVGSLTNALRGVNNWVAFLPVDGRPYLPAAYEHATVPWLVLVTALVAGLGLAGLTLPSTPERLFLVATALVGVAVLVMGYAGPLAEPMRALLDGPLSPFRNLHKFNALVRLPLVLGLAALVSYVGARRAAVRIPVAATCAGLIGLTLVPVASAGIAPSGAFSDVPGYWREAAAWLDQRADQGTVLILPGSRRGEYTWGRPIDEPFQPLLRKARWVSNTIVPWGTAGSSRLVDAIDDRFANGQGSAGLARTLRRVGIRYLVIRNDLDRVSFGGAWPARVHQALEGSPGIVRVSGYGPPVGFSESGTGSGWLDQPYTALEIYEVTDARPPVGTVSARRPLRVSGGPEALLTMAEEGVLDDDRPVVLGDDPGAENVPAADTVLTDTMRRRELGVSDLRRSLTETLPADEPFETERPVSDLTDPAWEEPKTVAVLSGADRVTASSSDSRLGAPWNVRDPGRQPYAALDGDVRTGWRSTGWRPPAEEWLEVRFTEPTAVPSLRAAFDRSDETALVSEVSVETDAGAVRTRVDPAAFWQRLNVRPGKTSRLRVRISRVATERSNKVGILDLSIPGLQPGRSLLVPTVPTAPDTALDTASSTAPKAMPDGTPDTVLSAAPRAAGPVVPDTGGPTVVTSRTDRASGCMRGSYAWTCADELGIVGEDGYGFDRTVLLENPGRRVISGRTALTDGNLAVGLLTPPDLYPKVTASSTKSDIPATGPWAAFDGDRSTIWYAHGDDLAPSLSADLGRTVQLSRLRVDFPDVRTGAPPVRVTITTDGGTRYAWASADGWIDFKPLRASRITLAFGVLGAWRTEVVDVSIPGVKPLPSYPDRPDRPLRLPCGYGPTFTVNGTAVTTEIVSGTYADLLNGRPLGYRGCASLPLKEGVARFTAASSQGYRVDSLVVADAGRTRGTGTRTGQGGEAARAGETGKTGEVVMRPAEVESWDASQRRVRVSTAEPSYLVVNENHNRGWQASIDGRRLQPARLDGWRQAWLLPPSTGVVVITYEPDGLYRSSLVAGGILVALVAALALFRPRPRPRLRVRSRPEKSHPEKPRPEKSPPEKFGYGKTLPEAPPARVRAAWLWPLAPLLGFWTQGWPGALLVGLVAALALWLREVATAEHSAGGLPYRAGRVLTSPSPVVVVLGAAGAALGYGGDTGQTVAQYLCLAGLGLLFAAIGTRPLPRSWLPAPAVSRPLRPEGKP